MPELELLPVLVATVAAFLCGGAYYAVLGAQLAAVSDAGGAMPPWKVGAELLRCLVLVVVVAWLAAEAGIDGVAGGLALGAALFVGFPLVLWTGAIVHEDAPRKLALIHGGDWLVKLLLIGMIVSVL